MEFLVRVRHLSVYHEIRLQIGGVPSTRRGRRQLAKRQERTTTGSRTSASRSATTAAASTAGSAPALSTASESASNRDAGETVVQWRDAGVCWPFPGVFEER